MFTQNTSQSFQPGERIGDYTLIEFLGDGGMGEVWKARHDRLQHLVAIKFLMVHDPVIKDRFLAEGRCQADLAIGNPHIVPATDFVSDAAGRTYLVLKLFEGGSLADRLEAGLPTDKEILRYSAEILGALQHAHSKNIYHRDVKPANILLDRRDSAHLTDFGIAKLVRDHRMPTQAGRPMGTPHYMSPEQIANTADVDGRADIYSFGCVLYEMLTGNTPFDGPTPAAVYQQHCFATPAAPSTRRGTRAPFPAAVDRVVLRSLEKDKNKRFGTCLEMLAALEAAFTPPPPPPPVPLPVPRRPIPRGVALVGLLALVLIIAWLILHAGGGGRLPSIAAFTATPPQIVAGSSSTLRWKVERADSVEISPGPSGLGPAGNNTVMPPGTQIYHLIARNRVGAVSEFTTVTVVPGGTHNPPPVPVPISLSIPRFDATPDRVDAGGKVTFSWEVTGATRIRIESVADGLGPKGNVDHYPGKTRTYTLFASNGGPEISRQFTVQVNEPSPTGTTPSTPPPTTVSTATPPPKAALTVEAVRTAITGPGQVVDTPITILDHSGLVAKVKYDNLALESSVTVRWTSDGHAVDDDPKRQTQTTTGPSGTLTFPFPAQDGLDAAGRLYHVEASMNGNSIGSWDFRVRKR